MTFINLASLFTPEHSISSFIRDSYTEEIPQKRRKIDATQVDSNDESCNGESDAEDPGSADVNDFSDDEDDVDMNQLEQFALSQL